MYLGVICTAGYVSHGFNSGTYRHVTLEGPTQARKLEIWEIGKVGLHVGTVGPKSMLNSRHVGDHLRGRRHISLKFLDFVNLDPGLGLHSGPAACIIALLHY